MSHCKTCYPCKTLYSSDCIQYAGDIDKFGLEDNASITDVIDAVHKIALISKGDEGDTIIINPPAPGEPPVVQPSRKDELVKVSSSDTTPGNLGDKLILSNCITAQVVNAGGNEKLKLGIDISCLLNAIKNSEEFRELLCSIPCTQTTEPLACNYTVSDIEIVSVEEAQSCDYTLDIIDVESITTP